MWLENGPGSGRVVHGGNVCDLLAREQPSEPVFCLDQALLIRRAKSIVAGFAGDICHDVTVNPHPLVLAALAQAGVRRFAVLRIEDLATLDRLPQAVVPVLRQRINSRHSLRIAAERHGVRVFTAGHPDELAKLREEVRADAVEVEIPAPLAAMRVRRGTAERSNDPVEGMVRAALDFGFRPSIAVHPGVSSANDVAAAMTYCRALGQRCGVVLEAVNFGSVDVGSDGEIETICAEACRQGGLPQPGPTRLRLDAGRALVGPCCSVLAQVLLRKSGAIYLNDGRFGWLQSLDDRVRGNAARPVLRRLNGTPSAASRRYRVFGPTCDAYDAFEKPIVLPADVREGDWIEFPVMGADTIAWACAFNGLHPSLFAVVQHARS
jgi:ornithine decarboxylase